MIEARKAVWFEKIFLLYTRNLLRRRFSALRVAGLENLVNRDCRQPLVLYANHSSWFDPLVAFVISQKISADAFAMMEEKNLRKLKFFRKIGAFSVVRENPREAVKSIRYAVQLLKEKPNRAVWIFPQGSIEPHFARPLKFYGGLARIIEQIPNCAAAPVAMRFEFLDDFKPIVLASIGAVETFPQKIEAKKITAHCAEKLTASLDTINNHILRGDFDNYELI